MACGSISPRCIGYHKAQQVAKRTCTEMLYVTFKENTNNITVKRAYGAGSFFVLCFFVGFFVLQLTLAML